MTPAERKADKSLRERLRSLFDPASLRVVTAGAIERRAAEKIVGKLTRANRQAIAALPRDELIGRLVAGFFDKDRVANDLIAELNRVCRSERSLVSSIEADEAAERLGSIKALQLRRHGAKLVWALATDDREEVWRLAGRVMREYVAQAERLDRARAEVRKKGAEEELREFEELYRHAAEEVLHLEEEFSQVEKERARLLAEIGQHKAQLRNEADRRRVLAEELEELRQARPQVAPPRKPEKDDSARRKLRKLEKQLAAAEHERDSLRSAAERVAELEQEVARLRRTVAGLREQRAQAREPLRSEATVPGSPLVESPRKQRARKQPSSKQTRVGVFIDVANLSGAARLLHDAAVDFGALLDLVAAGRNLAEARAFAIDKGSDGYEAFANALREAGYKVFTKKPKTFEDGTVKADWDVGMTVEMLAARDRLDVVVLGSGDGDFVPVVTALQGGGVRVEVAAWNERTAGELKRAADAFVALDRSVLEGG